MSISTDSSVCFCSGFYFSLSRGPFSFSAPQSSLPSTGTLLSSFPAGESMFENAGKDVNYNPHENLYLVLIQTFKRRQPSYSFLSRSKRIKEEGGQMFIIPATWEAFNISAEFVVSCIFTFWSGSLHQ